MIVCKAFKVRLIPTKQQIEYFEKCFYARTFVYNWFVYEKESYYEKNKQTIGFSELHKKFMEYRKQIPWIFEVNSRVYRFVECDCEFAYKSYFNDLTNKPKIQTFAKKRFSTERCILKSSNSFYVASGNLPNKKGRKGFCIKTKEDISFLQDMKITKLTISFDGKCYYCSFDYKYDLEQTYNRHKFDVVGIDWGVKTFSTQSDGLTFNFKKQEIIKLEKKISYIKSKLDKKQKDSNNYLKLRKKLSITNKKLTNIRRDFLHKYTTWLCKTYKTIKIEDLDIQCMAKNHKLAKSIYRGCFGTFKNMLLYKSKFYNTTIILVDRRFPSSKICSCCGNKKQKLLLSERTFVCEKCGLVIDRDLNAAINIANFA